MTRLLFHWSILGGFSQALKLEYDPIFTDLIEICFLLIKGIKRQVAQRFGRFPIQKQSPNHGISTLQG